MYLELETYSYDGVFFDGFTLHRGLFEKFTHGAVGEEPRGGGQNHRE